MVSHSKEITFTESCESAIIMDTLISSLFSLKRTRTAAPVFSRLSAYSTILTIRKLLLQMLKWTKLHALYRLNYPPPLLFLVTGLLLGSSSVLMLKLLSWGWTPVFLSVSLSIIPFMILRVHIDVSTVESAFLLHLSSVQLHYIHQNPFTESLPLIYWVIAFVKLKEVQMSMTDKAFCVYFPT